MSLVEDTMMLGIPNKSASQVYVFSFNELEGQNIANYVRDHAATLNFPEKFMYMMMHIERTFPEAGRDMSSAPIDWVLNGTAIVIRDENELIEKWLHPFFGRKLKLSSFLRKCYRWGFRKLSLTYEASLQAGDYVFIGCDWFQRDRKDLLYRMESVTTVKLRARKAKQSAHERAIDEARTLSPASGWDGMSSLHVKHTLDSLKAAQLNEPQLLSAQSQPAQYQQPLSWNSGDQLAKQGGFHRGVLQQEFSTKLMETAGLSTMNSQGGAILPFLSGVLTTLQQKQIQTGLGAPTGAGDERQGSLPSPSIYQVSNPEVKSMEMNTLGIADEKTQRSSEPAAELSEKKQLTVNANFQVATKTSLEGGADGAGRRAGANPGPSTNLGLQLLSSGVYALPDNPSFQQQDGGTEAGDSASARGQFMGATSLDVLNDGLAQEQQQQINSLAMMQSSSENYLRAFQYLLPFTQSAQHLLALSTFQHQLQQQQITPQPFSEGTREVAFALPQQPHSDEGVQVDPNATSRAPTIDNIMKDPNCNSSHIEKKGL